MFSWIRKLRLIVSVYDRDKQSLINRIAELDRLVRERTDIGVDVNQVHMDNHIIVVGKYKGVDYIQTFSVKNLDFTYLIDDLNQMRRHGSVRYVDSVPELRAVVKRDPE